MAGGAFVEHFRVNRYPHGHPPTKITVDVGEVRYSWGSYQPMVTRPAALVHLNTRFAKDVPPLTEGPFVAFLTSDKQAFGALGCPFGRVVTARKFGDARLLLIVPGVTAQQTIMSGFGDGHSLTLPSYLRNVTQVQSPVLWTDIPVGLIE